MIVCRACGLDVVGVPFGLRADVLADDKRQVPRQQCGHALELQGHKRRSGFGPLGVRLRVLNLVCVRPGDKLRSGRVNHKHAVGFEFRQRQQRTAPNEPLAKLQGTVDPVVELLIAHGAAVMLARRERRIPRQSRSAFRQQVEFTTNRDIVLFGRIGDNERVDLRNE